MSVELHHGVRLADATRAGAVTFTVTNPATGKPVATVAGASADDTRAAVDGAAAALPGWSATPAPARATALRRIADALRAEPVDGLARLVAVETGKRLAEAQAEVSFTAAFFDWFATAAASLTDGHRTDTSRRFIIARRPLGVVAALTPWNFPASIPARKVAAALAAGCTTVFKPSEFAPLSGLRFAEIVEPHLPVGAMTTVVGDGEELTNALIDDDRVAGVSFTGSTRVGALIAARCAPIFTRATLELGGRAPFIVCPDADVTAAVQTLLVAKFRNNGASCIAANNVFVHDSLHRDFFDTFADRAAALRLGDPLDEKTELGPMINAQHVERLNGLVRDARDRGATVVQGSDVPETGFFVPPTVVATATDMPLWSEEIFGPVAAIRSYTDEESLIAEVNSWDLGLGGYVCSADAAHAVAIAERLQIGIVGINNGAPNTPEVPFGGFKHSGLGREGGIEGLDEFCELQILSIALP